MRSLAYAIAVGALFAGTSVHAQSMAITGVKSGSITSGEWNVGLPNGLIVDDDNPMGVGYGGSTETKVKVKLSTELRLLETSLARLLKQVKTDIPAPESNRTIQARRAANARWGRDSA